MRSVAFFSTPRFAQVSKRQVYRHGCYDNPALAYDILAEVAKANVKTAMLALFNQASCEDGVKVIATKAFATGRLELVAFSNFLQIVKADAKRPNAAHPRQGCLVFGAKGTTYRIFLKPGLQFPKEQTIRDTAVAAANSCVVNFWAVQPAKKLKHGNMEHISKVVPVKVLGHTTEVHIPVLRNICPVSVDDELVAMTEEDEEPEEATASSLPSEMPTTRETSEGAPPAKKAKAQPANAREGAGGKTKGKGRNQAKGKAKR